MKVLIVKTSSMGDVIHTLPAVTDALHANPTIQFDWVVEEGFADIPRLHPDVNRVIPIAWRRWRKDFFKIMQNEEVKNFRRQIATKKYDAVIDAQGLYKSAIISRLANGENYGLNFQSAREPLASLFYNNKFSISKNKHAIPRVRDLLAQSLQYSYSDELLDYGIAVQENAKTDEIFFIHGSSRDDKLWPIEQWIQLAKLFSADNVTIKLPWGNETEKQRAEAIAAQANNCQVLPKTSLKELAAMLAKARAAIAVDTGLGHLAAAFALPTISIYGPTDPALIGAKGKNQAHIKVDDLSLLSAEDVYAKLGTLL